MFGYFIYQLGDLRRGNRRSGFPYKLGALFDHE